MNFEESKAKKMKRSAWLIILILMFCFITQPDNNIYAQSDSFYVCGRAFQIGMPKDTVLVYLKQRYNIINLSNDGSLWCVAKMDAKKMYDYKATFSFKDDKLFSISTPWDEIYDPKAVEAFVSLFSALSKLTQGKQGGEAAIIAINTRRAPKLTFTNMTISIGQREVTIGIIDQGLKGKSVTISEGLSSW